MTGRLAADGTPMKRCHLCDRETCQREESGKRFLEAWQRWKEAWDAYHGRPVHSRAIDDPAIDETNRAMYEAMPARDASNADCDAHAVDWHDSTENLRRPITQDEAAEAWEETRPTAETAWIELSLLQRLRLIAWFNAIIEGRYL